MGSRAGERTHRAWELGGDLLGLVGHVELGDLGLVLGVVRVDAAMDHANEGRLARAVLTQHDNDLAVCELPSLYVQLEVALQQHTENEATPDLVTKCCYILYVTHKSF